MGKTTIYLIRHSEQYRDYGLKSCKDSKQIENEKIILSEEGEIRAKELSQKKELTDIDSVWSSSYVRALSTAKYIAKENNLKINIDERLNERKLRRFRRVKRKRKK